MTDIVERRKQDRNPRDLFLIEDGPDKRAAIESLVGNYTGRTDWLYRVGEKVYVSGSRSMRREIMALVYGYERGVDATNDARAE